MRRLALALSLALFAGPLPAAPQDDLADALRMEDVLEIMREEGLDYGEEMAEDMFATGANPGWQALISEIYDTQKMGALVQGVFAAGLDEADAQALADYFSSAPGERVISLELAARRSMIDDGVEETAREAYQAALRDNDPRLERIDAFVAANDLVEANVAGALNASFQFYRGLVDGGAFAMSEEDIIAEVWGQEAETRADTREWLYGYLLMAYGPLDDSTLDDYIALSASPEGRALNAALFAGFNRMYDEISYALGLAAAQQMQVQEL